MNDLKLAPKAMTLIRKEHPHFVRLPTTTDVYTFCGKRHGGALIDIVDCEIDALYQDAVSDCLDSRYGRDAWKNFNTVVYNTLSLGRDPSDCRNRLRCCPLFHGRTEYSCIQLKSPLWNNGQRYRFGYSLLFFSIAMEDLLVVRLLREVDMSVDIDYEFLNSRMVFREITKHYTVLCGDEKGNYVCVVNSDDVLRQEQLCDVGAGLVLVNDFCHGNVFTSSKESAE